MAFPTVEIAAAALAIRVLVAVRGANADVLPLVEEAESAHHAVALDSTLRLAYPLTIVVAALAQIRAKYGPAPKQKPKEGERPLLSKDDVHSRAGRMDQEPGRDFLRTLGMTARLTSAEIFAWIEREFSAQDVRAMRLYYVEERDFEEIARELQLTDAKAADAVIRKLNARLRYRFAKE